MITGQLVAVAINTHAIVANGEAIIIVYFRPIERSENAAIMLPMQAPAGGIEPFYLLEFLIKKNQIQIKNT